MPGSVFVFSPDASYGLLGAEIAAEVHFVAAVSGPWKIFAVIDFDDASQVPGLVDAAFKREGGFGDPETALTWLIRAVVRHTDYYEHTALVRIDTDVVDPGELVYRIRKAIGSDEVDSVMGDFDILACVGDDDEEELARKVMAIREIEGVTRTVSLRVLDYRSRSEFAPAGKRLTEIS
jgi:hypothetical protein